MKITKYFAKLKNKKKIIESNEMKGKERMKELIIIFIIIIIIVGTDFYIDRYLKNSSEKIIESLNNLKEEIDRKEFTNKEIIKQANEIYERWQKTEEEWAMIVVHSEMDQIEIALIKMKTQIKENNLDIGLEELETSIFLINHISKKEQFNLINVF